jgi:hypothetical protein
MSDEQRKEEETEVKGHMRRYGSDETRDEGEDDDDVEAHVRRTNARME